MKKTITIVSILIIIFLVINLIPGFKKGLGNFVFKIFSPIGKLFSNIGKGIVGFFQIFINIGDLNRDNIDLRQKKLILETEINRLKEIENENNALHRALNISQSGQAIREIASVVGKDIQGIQDWILINRGAKHEIQKNMPVISPEGALIGRIIEVQNSFSKIMLITNKDSAVAAIVAESRAEGLVKRNEAGGLILDLIPKTEKLEIGQTIITSGMDNIFPKGILIGKIENIDSSENQIFQKIFVSPAIDFSKLETIIILKSK